MSRRRSSNPTKAISITLPESQIRQLDNILSIKQSRSQWISTAIGERLDKSNEIGESLEKASVEDLVSWLHFHEAITIKERYRIVREYNDR